MWTPDQEDLDSPYQPVRYSMSEPEVLDAVKAPPCRSHSAPGGVNSGQRGGHIHPESPGATTIGLPPPQHLYYNHSFHHHYIPHHPPLYHIHEPPPALPPKPPLKDGCILEEEPLQPPLAPTAPPAGRPAPCNISQPVITAAKEEPAKVAWGHGVSGE